MEVQSIEKKDGLKLVYLGTEVPDECIANAQVVIKTEDTWHVIAPNPYRMHCTADIPMPEVKCPIVDIRGVKDEEAMRAVMEKCTDKSAGVLNMAGLLTGLEALGAKVTQRVSEAASQRVRAADVAARFREKKEGRVARRVSTHMRKVAVN